MAQLRDRVREVEHRKAEKAELSNYHKKLKLAYVEVDEIENLSDIDNDFVKESEINVAELYV